MRTPMFTLTVKFQRIKISSTPIVGAIPKHNSMFINLLGNVPELCNLRTLANFNLKSKGVSIVAERKKPEEERF